MNETVTPSRAALGRLEDYMFRLRSIEYVQSYNREQVKQQLTLSYTLMIVTNGEVNLLVNHQHAEMNRDSVYLGLPEDTYGIADVSEGLEMYVFHFELFQYRNDSTHGVMPVSDVQLFHPKGKVMINAHHGLAAKCEELYRTWNKKEKRELFRCQIDFQEIIYYIHKYQLQEAITSSSAMEQAKQFIEEHYATALSIEQLAQMTKLSPKYFVDLFKRKYGRSAMEYAAELRMKEAKRLMMQADLKLREIAHRVGYSDEFYFSRKFKKEIGVSPSVYMNYRRRRVVVYQSELIGYMIALQVVPYAAPLHPKWTEYYYQAYRDEIPVHLSAYRYNRDWPSNMSLLQQHSADLIIAIDNVEEQELRSLERAAPNLCLVQTQLNWREQLIYMANQLGESWQAEKWLLEYENQVQVVKKQLHEIISQETIVCLRMIHNQLYIYCNQGMADLLYHDLKLVPAYKGKANTYDISVTLEQIYSLNPDHILMLVRQDTETLEYWARLQNDAQWQVITAVHRKRVHLLPSDPWREYSAHAQLRMLNQIGSLLSADHPSHFRILSMDASRTALYTLDNDNHYQ